HGVWMSGCATAKASRARTAWVSGAARTLQGSRQSNRALAVRPGQNREHTHDEAVQFNHVVAQELGRLLVADLARGRDQPRLEMDVGLDVVHQRRVAEAQHAAQMT